MLAEGEGNADSTPAPTEAVQPTESAEPTAPTETETPEVTEVPAPTPENPAATAEPTDEGIMPANVMPVQAETENNTPFTVDETMSLPRDSVGNVNYRAVMLDCGRKYFSVDNIKKLIDTMAQYGYNQLQLSFGNGGCRFLLDDMSLSFKGVTMGSDTVKTNITNGNYKFNGDTRYLSQTDMDAIITYAEKKGIEIVPMLNMLGHATAIVYKTNYSSSGNLNINNETSRYYGYALLKKYAEYFAGKGCKYFSFGADESGYTGNNMTAFLTGCANVIVEAGMIPRAFNDATNGATMPTTVQITYWHIEKNSQSASALANAGYEMINTHGRWYYVIKTAQNGEINSKYWQGKVNTAETSVELPVMKATKMDNGTWVGLNEYFDANPGYGSTIAASKGTMFCIWCDASQDTYLTDSDVISENENYGALYQLQKLAEHYWSNDITTEPTPNPTPTPDQTNGETVNVELIVGDEANGSRTFDVDGEITTNSDVYIATAEVTTGETTDAKVEKVTSIESGKKYLITNYRNDILLTNTASTYTENYVNYDALKLEGSPNTDSMQKWTFTGTVANNVYTGTVSSSDGKYLSVGQLTASTKETSQTLTLSYNTDYSCWTITQGNYYLNQLGGKDSRVAGGYTDGASDPGSRWYIYEITEASDGGSKLTITATGEGGTTVKVGNTTYNITVTAPERTETVQLAHGATYNLPEGATDVATSGDNVITVSGTTVTAGETDGTATVTAVVKNEGGYVTARYIYNITVSVVNLEGVDPLKVELWVTNRYAGGTHNGVTYAATEAGHIVPVSAAAAYGPDGVTLESLVPTNGKDEKDLDLLYWKGTRLGSSNKQTYTGTDMTGSGSDFQKIRYYEDSWQYYFDNNWVSVETGDQIIAYYMQVYNTSPEIVTAFRDYGGIAGKGGGEFDANWFAGYRGVGTAVVYSDKSMSPDGDDGIWNTTLICYYESASGGGTPGLIKVFDTEDFKITKITITKGVHKDSTGATGANATKTWNRTTSSILWDKTINDAGDEWYDEKLIWTSEGHTPGETITLDDSIWGDTWKTSGIGEAFLLLFYVEPVEKEDNLKVVYWDDNAKVRINPNDITISVKAGTTFINGIKQYSPVNAGTFTLDDDATIENSVGVNQKFNKNITILDGVAANYRSGIYEYVSADISEDGKTLTLHYNLKEITNKHSFVVDFGLPVEITGLLGWFNVTDAQTVANLSLSKANLLTDSTGSWGRAVINTKTWNSMTYTLDKMLSAKATIPLYCNLDGGKQLETQIEIIPATSVYYEDSFAKFYGSNGKEQTGFSKTNEVTAQTPGVWYIDGQEQTANQALEALGNKTYVYGYDPKYDNCTMFSMGSARKVTVTSDMANDGVVWPTAQFTFKGTGFDIISLTDNTSGAIYVSVYPGDKAEGTPKKYVVNNYYGYDYVDGKWVVKTDAGNNALYQIPVIKIKDLDYGTYTVVIKVAYSAFQDVADKKQYSFWLDAVRVYDPMGANNSDTYAPDGEAKPVFVEVRDMLLSASSVAENNTNNGVVFIDGNGSAAIATDYKNFGPNHEVYLANNQAIAFTIADAAKYADIQIGIKSTGNSAVKYKINNGTEATIGTATDMYYSIKDYASNGGVVTITNTGEAVLSITNIKCTMGTSSAKTDTVDLVMSAEDVAVAISMVNSAITPVEPEPEPEPEKTFEPDRFEASWSRNVMQGRKATLTVKTSEDVEAITVDGQTIRSYRTRTERVGFGRRAKRITYREFTYSMVAQESADFSVTAINTEGTESEAITARLTVKTRPNSLRDMWDWFKGWF